MQSHFSDIVFRLHTFKALLLYLGMDWQPVDNRPWYVQANEKARKARLDSSSLDPLQVQHHHLRGSLWYHLLAKVWTNVSFICFIEDRLYFI